MKVADLQKLLGGLIQMLEGSGGKGPAGELEQLRTCLEPLNDLSLGEFAGVLHQAVAVRRGGTATSGRTARARSKPPDQEKIGRAVRSLEELYERAMNPASLQHDAISAEIARL